MELRQMRYFIAVAEELHFGRAAERLGITQPPLSFQIHSLERELGVHLLVRGRRIGLTEAGRAFLDKARATLDIADAAARAAQQADQVLTERLRIGYPATGASQLPPRALRTFRQRFPHVGVQTVVASSGPHLEAFGTNQLDMAFVQHGVLDRERLQFRPLERMPLLLAAAPDHPLVQLQPIPAKRLAGEPIIMVPAALEPVLHRYLVSQVLGRAHVAPMVALETATLESTLSAVAAGLGVAFVAEPLTGGAMPGVVYLPFAPPCPQTTLGVAWRQGATSNTVRRFLEVLDELGPMAQPAQPRRRSSKA